MRSNSSTAATGVSVAFSRAKFMKADDRPRMQESEVRIFHDEAHKGIERFQQYGFTSVPLPPDPGNGGKAAEAVIAYLGAHRSHPVVLAVDDRRSRPRNWKDGESGLWHYKGAFCKHTDAGWVYDAGSAKQPHTTTVGNASVKIEDNKITATVDKMVIVITPKKICLVSADATDPLMLLSGPSKKIFGVV